LNVNWVLNFQAIRVSYKFNEEKEEQSK